MPRSLSGVRSGEFDTIEVTEKMTAQDLETQGRVSHLGNDAAEFRNLQVGTDVGVGANTGLLTVHGNIACSNITTNGLEA